ncbi:hypothetical protein ANO14919_132030 [Xylariales sp. No.14919]|nr:hypothetical protein ANO14919_132030 [Xylariales sp. No.14919]
MKHTPTHNRTGHAFNHRNPRSADLKKPARTARPVAVLQRVASRLRTSLSRQRLNKAVYRVMHGYKQRRPCEYGLFGASDTYIASDTTLSLGENPMANFLSTEEQCNEFAEARRMILTRVRAASRATASGAVTSRRGGRSLDDLPPEILIQIWKYVAETPSWFHVKYGSRQIYPVAINRNREHWVNKRWYFAAEFRASLSQHPIQDNMHRYAMKLIHTTLLFENIYRNGVSGPLVKTTVDTAYSMLEWSKIDTGCEPFRIRLEGVERFPIVRPATDWFFLENYVTTLALKAFNVTDMPPAPHLVRVSTVVLKLDDIYRGICLSLNRRSDGRPREPWLVDRGASYIRRMSIVLGTLMDYTAQLEKCMILVGGLQSGVQPSDLQEISVEWLGPENASSDTRRDVVTFPKVSSNDRAMVRFVHQELECFAKLQREWRNELLRSPDGQAWLEDIGHEKGSMRSEWLASTEGRIWRETTEEGNAWLQAASGHWWLASIPGSPWLETPRGMEWLDSEAGALFLVSPMARVWAGVDNGGGDEAETQGREEAGRRLPRKNWFDTEKGRAWVDENCPDYRVPVAPEPPRPDDAGNEASERLVHLAQFLVRPPPRWGFVMAPAPLETCPRVRTDEMIKF